MKTVRLLTTIVIPFLLFTIISVCVLTGNIQCFDAYIYSKLQNIISNRITFFMAGITNMASSLFICILCFLTLPFFFIKQQKYSFYSAVILINICISSFLNVMLKNIFERARPEILQLVEVSGHSYPSGHSMAAMSFYGFLIYLIYKNVKSINHKLITTILLLLGVLIALIGLSRIYLGVHYASDVFGGFSISLVWLGVFTLLIDKYKEKAVKKIVNKKN